MEIGEHGGYGSSGEITCRGVSITGTISSGSDAGSIPVRSPNAGSKDASGEYRSSLGIANPGSSRAEMISGQLTSTNERRGTLRNVGRVVRSGIDADGEVDIAGVKARSFRSPSTLKTAQLKVDGLPPSPEAN